MSVALFHDSPARWADSVNVNGCDMFPFAFCSTCWVEGEKTGNHGLVLIWGKIKAVIKFWQRSKLHITHWCSLADRSLSGYRDTSHHVKFNTQCLKLDNYYEHGREIQHEHGGQICEEVLLMNLSSRLVILQTYIPRYIFYKTLSRYSQDILPQTARLSPDIFFSDIKWCNIFSRY